jgi:hypothetical protein
VVRPYRFGKNVRTHCLPLFLCQGNSSWKPESSPIEGEGAGFDLFGVPISKSGYMQDVEGEIILMKVRR